MSHLVQKLFLHTKSQADLCCEKYTQVEVFCLTQEGDIPSHTNMISSCLSSTGINFIHLINDMYRY